MRPILQTSLLISVLLVSGLAQGFYIWRIWHLTKQLWLPLPIALVSRSSSHSSSIFIELGHAGSTHWIMVVWDRGKHWSCSLLCLYLNDVSLVQRWTLDGWCVQPLIAPSYSTCGHAIILIRSLYLVQVWLGGSAVCDVLITMALTFIVSTQFATRNRLTWPTVLEEEEGFKLCPNIRSAQPVDSPQY